MNVMFGRGGTTSERPDMGATKHPHGLKGLFHPSDPDDQSIRYDGNTVLSYPVLSRRLPQLP
jgi:hypothetical protein